MDRSDTSARVVAAQGSGHDEDWDYNVGSPHLRHRQLRARIEGHLRRLIADSFDRTQRCRVLEIGAGHGSFSDCMLAAGADVTVTEASAASALRLVAKYANNPSATVLHDASGEDVLGLEGPWDLVVCVSVLHHIPDYGDFVGGLVTRIPEGGAFYSVQDPLWYPRMSRAAHRTHFAAYFLWRLFRGKYRQGIATRWRRMLGVYDESNPSDLIEYHVVRSGVDEKRLYDFLRIHFSSVEVFRYWSTQSPPLHALGTWLDIKTNFGIVAEGKRTPG